MKLLSTTILFALLLSTSAFAKNKLIINKFEVKNIISLLEIVAGDDIRDCKKDSDCDDDEICVGIGICVPESTANILSSKLPKMMKRY